MPDYLPIDEHGIIGDLHTVALVGTDGTIDWYCCPSGSTRRACSRRSSTPSGRLLPDRAGRRRPHHQAALPPGHQRPDHPLPDAGRRGRGAGLHARSHRDPAHRHRLIRRVICVRGEMRFELECEPRFDYARAEHETIVTEQGAVFRSADACAELASTVPARAHRAGRPRRVRAARGRQRTFVARDLPRDQEPARDRRGRGRRGLRPHRPLLARLAAPVALPRALARDGAPLGAHAEAAHLQPTGAIVAAPTTSLPERIGGERNWDYRYTWIRDAAFSLYALLRLGFTEEAGGVHGLAVGPLPRARRPRRRARCRSCTASTAAPTCPRSWCSTTSRATAARPGADRQRRRHPAAARHLRRADRLRLPLQQVRRSRSPTTPGSTSAGSSTGSASNWDQADEGIWEVRGGRQNFTYSRLMCWVAVERAIRIARQRGLPADLDRWRDRATRSTQQIMERGWHPQRERLRPALRHRRARRLGAADAAVQVHRADRPALALDARRDQRASWSPTASSTATTSRPRRTGSTARRAPSRSARSGTSRRWPAPGSLDEARLAFEKMLTYANHLGLYAEEIGPTGEALGNFPQAFTHLALIIAAVNLDAQLG